MISKIFATSLCFLIFPLVAEAHAKDVLVRARDACNEVRDKDGWPDIAKPHPFFHVQLLSILHWAQPQIESLCKEERFKRNEVCRLSTTTFFPTAQAESAGTSLATLMFYADILNGIVTEIYTGPDKHKLSRLEEVLTKWNPKMVGDAVKHRKSLPDALWMTSHLLDSNYCPLPAFDAFDDEDIGYSIAYHVGLLQLSMEEHPVYDGRREKAGSALEHDQDHLGSIRNEIKKSDFLEKRDPILKKNPRHIVAPRGPITEFFERIYALPHGDHRKKLILGFFLNFHERDSLMPSNAEERESVTALSGLKLYYGPLIPAHIEGKEALSQYIKAVYREYDDERTRFYEAYEHRDGLSAGDREDLRILMPEVEQERAAHRKSGR